MSRIVGDQQVPEPCHQFEHLGVSRAEQHDVEWSIRRRSTSPSRSGCGASSSTGRRRAAASSCRGRAGRGGRVAVRPAMSAAQARTCGGSSRGLPGRVHELGEEQPGSSRRGRRGSPPRVSATHSFVGLPSRRQRELPDAPQGVAASRPRPTRAARSAGTTISSSAGLERDDAPGEPDDPDTLSGEAASKPARRPQRSPNRRSRSDSARRGSENAAWVTVPARRSSSSVSTRRTSSRKATWAGVDARRIRYKVAGDQPAWRAAVSGNTPVRSAPGTGRAARG